MKPSNARFFNVSGFEMFPVFEWLDFGSPLYFKSIIFVETGHENSDPIIKVVASIFRIAEIEKRALEAGNNNDRRAGPKRRN